MQLDRVKINKKSINKYVAEKSSKYVTIQKICIVTLKLS